MKNIRKGQLGMSARQNGLKEEIREVKESVVHEISTTKDM